MDAIIKHHYNPEIGLNTEMLYFDFTRPKGEERKSRLGHGVEVLWMVMDEADRRGDAALWEICAETDSPSSGCWLGPRVWRNESVGERRSGRIQVASRDSRRDGLRVRFVGEYNYMKTFGA